MSVRIGLLLFSLFFLAACAKDTVTGLFPESNSQNNNGQSDSPNDPSTHDADDCSSTSLVQNRFIVHWVDGHVSVETSENAALFKEKFIRPRLEQIQHVEFDKVVHLHDATTAPAPTTGNSWGQIMTQAAAAWNQQVSGQNVLVGVVDAAVDYTHPQIQPRLAQNLAEINGRAGIDDDANGFIDDFYGWDFEQNKNDPTALIYPLPATGSTKEPNSHGTHVSGIIAGDSTKGIMQGLAPLASIVPANFMDSNGSGSLGAAIQAIQYVSSRGVKVINASWGGPVCSETLRSVIQGLAAKNILFVAASGNDGADLDSTPDYPANFNFPNQINVAASNANDFLTSWSNTSFEFVHLGAPGDSIYSTVPGNSYAFMSGTSMAAPFVTGTAALLWSFRPKATYAQIRQAILAGTDSKNFRVQTGGRLNISNSISALKQILPNP
jgi:subtilisin family serine protease